jgi:hypothetical protein
MIAWIPSIFLWLLALYCFVATRNRKAPMPRWKAAFDPPPGPSVTMSGTSRAALGMTLMVFGCAPFAGMYRPDLWNLIMVTFVLGLIILMASGFWDWHRR